MKNISLLLLLAIAFTFPACLSIPNPNGIDDNAFDYGEFCDDLNGGDFSVKIDGKNWSTACVEASYTETITDTYSQKYLFLYAYNGDGTYFAGSDIEMLWVVWSEVTSGGETESSQGAVFYDGFINYQQLATNPNYEAEEFNAYTSDDEDENNSLVITSTTSDKVKGNLTFELIEEDTGAAITLSGNFSANITE